MKSISIDDIRTLPIEERIRLAGEIRDTIPKAQDIPPLSETLKTELDQRLEDHAKNPSEEIHGMM